MKNLNKKSLVLFSCGLCTLATMAANISQTNYKEGDYRILLSNDCELVAEFNMTPAQIAAYQELQKIEGTMHEFERPIKAIEQQMQEYSEQLESLTALAIQENDSSIHIDKTYLKQQEAVAQQLTDLVQLHQADFDALGQQGAKITAVAQKFETAMVPTLDGVEHDQIEILSPDKPNSKHYCHKRM